MMDGTDWWGLRPWLGCEFEGLHHHEGWILFKVQPAERQTGGFAVSSRKKNRPQHRSGKCPARWTRITHLYLDSLDGCHASVCVSVHAVSRPTLHKEPWLRACLHFRGLLLNHSAACGEWVGRLPPPCFTVCLRIHALHDRGLAWRDADLTTFVPPRVTCMSTLQVPLECDTRLTSENSACTGRRCTIRRRFNLRVLKWKGKINAAAILYPLMNKMYKQTGTAHQAAAQLG